MLQVARDQASGRPPSPDTPVTVGSLVHDIIHGVAALLLGVVQLALAVALFVACALFLWKLLLP